MWGNPHNTRSGKRGSRGPCLSPASRPACIDDSLSSLKHLLRHFKRTTRLTSIALVYHRLTPSMEPDFPFDIGYEPLALPSSSMLRHLLPSFLRSFETGNVGLERYSFCKKNVSSDLPQGNSLFGSHNLADSRHNGLT